MITTQAVKTSIRNLNPIAAATTLALASFASTPVMAEESQADADSKMEAITVTATKRSQVIYEVPIAMSAFSGDDLASQGIGDINGCR